MIERKIEGWVVMGWESISIGVSAEALTSLEDVLGFGLVG